MHIQFILSVNEEHVLSLFYIYGTTLFLSFGKILKTLVSTTSSLITYLAVINVDNDKYL